MLNRFVCLAAALIMPSLAAQTSVSTSYSGPTVIPVLSNSTLYASSMAEFYPGKVTVRDAFPLAPINVNAPALGTSVGDRTFLLSLTNSNGNNNALQFFQVRNPGPANWYSASTRIQAATDGSAEGYVEFNPFGAPDAVSLGAGDTEVMRLVDGGKVGIGTPTPNSRLEVNGDLRLTQGSGGTLIFPDGTIQRTAAGAQTNGIASINNPAGSTGFQFDTNTQTIGGTFGSGGNLTMQANSVQNNTDPDAGGSIFLGGSQRGDNQKSRVVLRGSIFPSVAAVTVDVNNRVGVGVSNGANLSQALEVGGNIKISGQGGGIIFNGPDLTPQTQPWTGTVPGGDYAESVDVTGDKQQYEAGDLLMIDADHPGQFLKVTAAYSSLVAGVYATKPGVIGRRQPLLKDRSTEIPMALVGIVPTKVSAENGPIRPGDLLVASSTPGYAMRGTDRGRLLGAVIGKALAAAKGDKDLIEVLITLQ